MWWAIRQDTMMKMSSNKSRNLSVLFIILVSLCCILQVVQGEPVDDDDDELVFRLRGFSSLSGLKVDREVVDNSISDGVEEPDFTICMRIRIHFERPEYVLASFYKGNRTAVAFGVNEKRKKAYFKYSLNLDTDELTVVEFDWMPNLETWEHLCFVKKPETGKPLSQIKFFVNGKVKGQASGISAKLHVANLAFLGQSFPHSSLTAFAGEIANFNVWTNPLPLREIKKLANCHPLDVQAEPVNEFQFDPEIWSPLTSEEDSDVTPVGFFKDKSEVCSDPEDNSEPDQDQDSEEGAKPKKPKRKTADSYLLPIYRKKDLDFHKETCESMNGAIPDLANFGKPDSDVRRQFLTDLYRSAKIPKVISPSGFNTPMNMKSCFVNKEFVIWLEDSKEAVRPPRAPGAPPLPPKGVPIDPRTGKPFNFLPPGLNVAFGPSMGPDPAKEAAEAGKKCPFAISADGSLREKCGSEHLGCSVCLVPLKKPTLKLRGICEEARLKDHRNFEETSGKEEFDTHFYPRVDKFTGNIVFKGHYGSQIKKENNDWVLESLVSPWKDETFGRLSKIPDSMLPVGRYSWEILSRSCDDHWDGNPEDGRDLTLTTCKRNEFTCKNGKCISLDFRCDRYDDCDGGEDELDCTFLEVDDEYKNEVSPRHIQKGVPWPVYFGVDIVSFPEIVAIEQRVKVNFYLTLRWYDPRLEFRNLKEGKLENPINAASLEQIWIPRLSLLNGLDEFQTVVTEEDAKYFRAYVWRRSNVKFNDLDNAVEDQIFSGSKNPIIMSREFYQEFTCHFDLSWYPFDRQVCFMNFTVQGQTSKSLILRPDTNIINYLGKKYLVEYRVETQKLIIPVVDHGNYSTASVELVFQRRVVYHLLNIYVQSLLLILTGYMSLFFHVNNFTDRVMVALTVMLVMASLQSSIQDQLPKTSYFKFIDGWILFVLNSQEYRFQIGLMVFHTFLGWYTAQEYRAYKDDFLMGLRRASKSIGNSGYKADKDDINGALGSDDLPVMANDLDDLIPSEEYDYPKSKRLNMWVNIVFIVSLGAFNLVYWTVAIVIYFNGSS